jgi:hypothetical protein
MVLVLALASIAVSQSQRQRQEVVLQGTEFTKVCPTSFYFEGQSAPTQMRNAAAARFGRSRYVIVGMVDTSGYSTEIRAKYQGFFITDSPIKLGDVELGTGAYGFGFSNDGKINIFDIGGAKVLSADTARDRQLRRPRPLVMMKAEDGIRLYSGREYVIISASR